MLYLKHKSVVLHMPKALRHVLFHLLMNPSFYTLKATSAIKLLGYLCYKVALDV